MREYDGTDVLEQKAKTVKTLYLTIVIQRLKFVILFTLPRFCIDGSVYFYLF